MIDEVEEIKLPEKVKPRQVAVIWERERQAVGILGWDAKEGRDQVWIKEAEGGWKTVRLGASGPSRILASTDGFLVQDKTGEISLSELLSFVLLKLSF